MELLSIQNNANNISISDIHSLNNEFLDLDIAFSHLQTKWLLNSPLKYDLRPIDSVNEFLLNITGKKNPEKETDFKLLGLMQSFKNLEIREHKGPKDMMYQFYQVHETEIYDCLYANLKVLRGITLCHPEKKTINNIPDE